MSVNTLSSGFLKKGSYTVRKYCTKERMIVVGLFFENANKQSKAQKIIANIFWVFVLCNILNSLVLNWIWFTAVSFSGAIVFCVIFVYFLMRKPEQNAPKDIDELT